jgi:hypothetical protein
MTTACKKRTNGIKNNLTQYSIFFLEPINIIVQSTEVVLKFGAEQTHTGWIKECEVLCPGLSVSSCTQSMWQACVHLSTVSNRIATDRDDDTAGGRLSSVFV